MSDLVRRPCFVHSFRGKETSRVQKAGGTPSVVLLL